MQISDLRINFQLFFFTWIQVYFVLASHHFNVTYVLLLLLLLLCCRWLPTVPWSLYLSLDSILNFIAKSLQPVINVRSSLYADGKGFLNPSIITGENYGPELLFLIQSKCLNVLEWTSGFESNLNNNAVRKNEKYLNLIKEMSRNYRCV